MAAWLDRLPVNIRMQGLGGPRLQQNSTNSTNSVAGFITQGPMPAPSLEAFRASVRKPAQPAVTLTHRYQLSQQAPKVCMTAPLRLQVLHWLIPDHEGLNTRRSKRLLLAFHCGQCLFVRHCALRLLSR